MKFKTGDLVKFNPTTREGIRGNNSVMKVTEVHTTLMGEIYYSLEGLKMKYHEYNLIQA